MAAKMPVVTLMGPRQPGKTSKLVKEIAQQEAEVSTARDFEPRIVAIMAHWCLTYVTG